MDRPPRRSRVGLLLTLGIGVVVIVILVFFIISLGSRTSVTPVGGGTAVATPPTELDIYANCLRRCTPSFTACISNDRHGINLFGVGCGNTCIGIRSIPFPGCSAPSCGSNYCTPQTAEYSYFINGNPSQKRLYCGNFMDTVDFPTDLYPPESCPDPVGPTGNPPFLNTLVIKRSDRAQGQIRPIFITTVRKSIYSLSAFNTGLTGASLNELLLKDPFVLTVVPNSTSPTRPAGLLQFQSYSFLAQNNRLNLSIWVFDSPIRRLMLYQDMLSATPSVVTQATPEVDQEGCSRAYYNPNGFLNFRSVITYDDAAGFFKSVDSTSFNVDGDFYMDDKAECNTAIGDLSRWYSFDADPSLIHKFTR